MSARGIPVTQQELGRAGALLKDGASQREVTRTTGISRTTLRKYFPGECWTFKDGGDFRALTRDDGPWDRAASLPWWEGA